MKLSKLTTALVLGGTFLFSHTVHADQPLDCQWDADYTCDQWLEDGMYSEYLADVRSTIRNSEHTIHVTQELIHSLNESGAKLTTMAFNMAGGGAIIATITRYGVQKGLQASVVDALLQTIMGEVLSKISETSLQVGEKFVIKGGQIVEYYDVNGNLIDSSDNGADLGGGRDEHDPDEDEDDYGDDDETDLEEECVTVYTGSDGDMEEQEVCWLE